MTDEQVTLVKESWRKVEPIHRRLLAVDAKARPGDEFTPEVRAAWVAAYRMLATTMIDAAEAAQPS